MNKKWLAFLLILSQVAPAFALDENSSTDEANFYIQEELIPIINNAHNTIYRNLNPLNSCNENPKEGLATCPIYLLKLVKDNYRAGLSGNMDHLTGDGSMTSPDKVCGGRISSPYSPAEFIRELNKSPYAESAPRNILANSVACMNLLKREKFDDGERKRAQQYIMASMLYSKERLTAAYKNMLESKSQLDVMLGGEGKDKYKEDCNRFSNQELHMLCQSASTCNFKNTHLEDRSTELTEAIKTIQKLKEKKIWSRAKEDKDRAQQGIDSLIALYPALENSSFKKVMDETAYPKITISKDKVKKALKKDLMDTRERVIAQLKSLGSVSECLAGKYNNCGRMNEILAEATPGWKDAGNLPYWPYYNCIEEIKDRRDKDDRFLGNAFLSASMALIPMGVVGAAGSLYNTGKIIKSAATLANIAKAVEVTATAADTALAVKEVAKIYSACKPKLDVLANYQNMSLSCSIIDKKVQLTTDVSECHQQIISGVMSAAFAGLGIGMLKFSNSNSATSEAVEAVAKKVDDLEFKGSIDDVLSQLKDPKSRVKTIQSLNTRLSTLAKSKEYTPEEIKTAIKVFLKKCGK